MPASISRISPRHGVLQPATPTASVSTMKVLAADRAASGAPCSSTLSTCATILSTTGSCNTPPSLAWLRSARRGAEEGLQRIHHKAPLLHPVEAAEIVDR